MRRALVLVAVVAAAAFPEPVGARPASGTPNFLSDLEFPTNMAFAPDGRLFLTEKDTGRVRIVEDGRLLPEPFATLPVLGSGESGLLGLALDPKFPDEPWVYVYYTSSDDGRNHLVRIEARGDSGGRQEELLTLLEASGIHNGGEIVFGPDGKLYVAVGETGDAELSQDLGSLGGKVLRLNPDGSVPADNPFGPDNPAFSLGNRNSFGLCFGPRSGDLWETENGPDRDDELNVIRAAGNYGWPEHLGAGGEPAFVPPVWVWEDVIVVTGCAFWPESSGNSDRELFVGDFHGDLHRLTLGRDMRSVERDDVVAQFPSGVTDLQVGPDGALYVATASSIERIGSPEDLTAAPGPSANGGAPWFVAIVGGGALLILLVGLGLTRRRRT